MSWEKWVLIAAFVLGALILVGTIGKPRTPVTPAVAVISLIINAGYVALIVLA